MSETGDGKSREGERGGGKRDAAMGRPWRPSLTDHVGDHGGWGYGAGGGQRAAAAAFPEAGVRSLSTVSPHLQVNQARVPAAREGRPVHVSK